MHCLLDCRDPPTFRRAVHERISKTELPAALGNPSKRPDRLRRLPGNHLGNLDGSRQDLFRLDDLRIEADLVGSLPGNPVGNTFEADTGNKAPRHLISYVERL